MEVDLEPYINAWSPEHTLTYRGVALRDRPGRLLKQLDQKVREAALVDTPMGWFVAMAGEMDMGAARGGIDTQWVPFAPYLTLTP